MSWLNRLTNSRWNDKSWVFFQKCDIAETDISKIDRKTVPCRLGGDDGCTKTNVPRLREPIVKVCDLWMHCWLPFSVCPSGSFGPPSCSQTCHCINGDACHAINGTCSNGCSDGWKGNSCDTPGIAFVLLHARISLRIFVKTFWWMNPSIYLSVVCTASCFPSLFWSVFPVWGSMPSWIRSLYKVLSSLRSNWSLITLKVWYWNSPDIVMKKYYSRIFRI